MIIAIASSNVSAARQKSAGPKISVLYEYINEFYLDGDKRRNLLIGFYRSKPFEHSGPNEVAFLVARNNDAATVKMYCPTLFLHAFNQARHTFFCERRDEGPTVVEFTVRPLTFQEQSSYSQIRPWLKTCIHLESPSPFDKFGQPRLGGPHEDR